MITIGDRRDFVWLKEVILLAVCQPDAWQEHYLGLIGKRDDVFLTLRKYGIDRKIAYAITWLKAYYPEDFYKVTLKYTYTAPYATWTILELKTLLKSMVPYDCSQSREWEPSVSCWKQTDKDITI